MEPGVGVGDAPATSWRLELAGHPRDLTIGVDHGMAEPYAARFVAPEPSVDVRRGVVSIRFRRSRRAARSSRSELTLKGTFAWEIVASGGMRGFDVDLRGTTLLGLDVDHATLTSTLSLPRPRGTVPIHFQGGLVGVTIERPPATAVRVKVGSGASRLTLDGNDFGAIGRSVDRQTPDFDRTTDRYVITIAHGASDVGIRTSDPAVGVGRRLATVLFTDIVGSTQLLAELGDRAWSERLGRHDRVAGEVVAEHGGRVVKQTGDGMLAAFDRPSAAIAAALACRDRVLDDGIVIRAGIHTGEVELREQDLGGFAVHLAARIMGEARGGEVLVSRTVRDLVVGDVFDFEDRGVHVLRGLEEEWHLFAVVDDRS